MVAVATLPARMPVTSVVELLHEALDGRAPSIAVPAGAHGRLLREIDRALNRRAALRLEVVADAHRADVAAQTGQSGTSSWLAGETRTTGAAAAGQVALAAALESGLGATRSALADGVVSTQHAGIIATTSLSLPRDLTDEERSRVERALVRDAQQMDPARFRRAARRALAAALRPAREVDEHEDTQLRTEEERAWDSAHLTLHDNGDGTTTGRFTVPALAGAILRKAVQQLASPRRAVHRSASPSAIGTREVDWSSVDWAQRQGQAFTELLEHLPTDGLSGKVAATVVVTMALDQLTGSLRAAHLDTGLDLSASDARRLACNAGLVPAVLGGRSQVLDLGRAERFFTEAQRTALATIYDECAVEGCDRPYAWADLHHETPWVRRGNTDLADAVPACGFHHRRLHDPMYRHVVHRQPSGRKIVSLRLRT